MEISQTKINSPTPKSLEPGPVFKHYSKDKIFSKFKTINQNPEEKLNYLVKLLKFNFFDELGSQLKLLYRASEQNFDGEKFHELCDNKGPTLILIRSHLGKIFGGFANASWNNNGEDIFAPKSFVFSLSHLTKHRLLKGKEEVALRGSKVKNGPIFGGGSGTIWDICLKDKCDKNKESHSELGISYELPVMVEPKSNEAKSYLAGAAEFSIEEYEVFEVKKENKLKNQKRERQLDVKIK